MNRLEKQDDAIAEIKSVRKQKIIAEIFGTNTSINITIHKEYGRPSHLRFTSWRNVNKLKATIIELLEGE